MPLYKTIHHDSNTQILIWEITESLQKLTSEVVLSKNSAARLHGMKSVVHQCGFLSVRKLLQEIGYTDFDLFYDEFGKPHLKDGRHISISHSHDFSTLILTNENCGIDLEMQREKIIRIADKFVTTEFDFLNPSDQSQYIKMLTVIWGAKEAVFKIRNEAGISFKDHIHVQPINLNRNQTTATLRFTGKITFDIFFEEIANFMVVYAFEKV